MRLSRDGYAEKLLKAYNEHGMLNQTIADRYVSYKTIMRHFGNLAGFLQEYGLPLSAGQENSLHASYTDNECLAIVRSVYAKHGKITAKLLKGSGISMTLLKSRFGTMRSCLELAGLPVRQGQRKFISKEEILLEASRINDKFGYVSKPLFEQHSGYSPKIIQRIWGSFDSFYSETGYSRSMSGYVATDEELLEDLLRLSAEHGYVSQNIITHHGKFSTTTYKDRFGCVNNAYEAAGLDTRLPGESINANFVIRKYSEFLNEEAELEKTFDWLRNPKNNYKLRIDAYFPGANLALEYNGPQHYHVDDRYCMSEDALLYRQWLDSLKSDLLKEHGVKLVVVHYKDRITSEYVAKSLC